MSKVEGYLEVGINDRGEVVVNLPEGKTGHIVFSQDQARGLARTLDKKAWQARFGSGPEPAGYCTDCGVSVASFDGLSQCPNCGSKGLPCDHASDVLVRLNWHELRLLIMWAERWALMPRANENPFGQTVYSIAERIAEQYPEKAKDCPLTLAGEIGQVRDAGYKIQTNFPGVEGVSIDPPECGGSGE